jgi:hypothetical protein
MEESDLGISIRSQTGDTQQPTKFGYQTQKSILKLPTRSEQRRASRSQSIKPQFQVAF